MHFLTFIKIIINHLRNRIKGTKVESSCSSWEAIEHGDPILHSLLFNIFLCDIFLLLDKTNFASYADHITPYTQNDNVDQLIRTIEEISVRLSKWFKDNKVKLNPDKCHLL